MDTSLQNLIQALKELGDTIISTGPDDRTLSEIGGNSWNLPHLNRVEIANLPLRLAHRLEGLEINQLEQAEADKLNNAANRIKTFQAITLPHVFNNEGHHSLPVLLSLLEYVESLIQPLVSWEYLLSHELYPRELTRRLRAMKGRLDSLENEVGRADSNIKAIKEVREMADRIPDDLRSLDESQGRIQKVNTESIATFARIEESEKGVKALLESIEKNKVESDKLVKRCEEAYRITTSTGLAGAFEQRAAKLNQTIRHWVWILILSLIAGGVIGYFRFKSFSEHITTLSTLAVWMEFVLSVLGLAAPVWIAWLATKQIGQRFKIAEDYGFKSSVSKAYEGYRKEAVNLDAAFAAKLFNSALTRLEEAPLRFVDKDSHGSPWGELLASKGFKEIIDLPDFRDKFFDLLKSYQQKTEQPPLNTTAIRTDTVVDPVQN